MKRSVARRAHVKERYPSVFRSLQADARDYPGGLPALADQLGRSYGSLRNALGPTNHDSEPTLELFLEILEATGGARSIPATARLGDQTALPFVAHEEGSCAEAVRQFLEFVGHAGAVQAGVVEAVADGRLCSAERTELADLLDDLLRATLSLRAIVRGR